VPSKVSNFVKSEVSKTKEYQTKVWAEAKTKWPWNVLLKGKNDTQN
jgi:lipid II:glycine glycyltransferase (peptidoglycan interpeptide bridge formation enzyme)